MASHRNVGIALSKKGSLSKDLVLAVVRKH